MASCPCRVSRCAAPLQPDLDPSCVDCASNSRIASIERGSDGTGTICKGLHLHGGSLTETRHRSIAKLNHLVSTLGGVGFYKCIERGFWYSAAFVRVHSRFVLREFS